MSDVDVEERASPRHPLRLIRRIVKAALVMIKRHAPGATRRLRDLVTQS